ncbi:hypothetical protein HGA91_03540 [candidate division WWE3 bacterium]|nr:hypothetical protein [candidate division WWE3 bacterium]
MLSTQRFYELSIGWLLACLGWFVLSLIYYLAFPQVRCDLTQMAIGYLIGFAATLFLVYGVWATSAQKMTWRAIGVSMLQLIAVIIQFIFIRRMGPAGFIANPAVFLLTNTIISVPILLIGMLWFRREFLLHEARVSIALARVRSLKI